MHAARPSADDRNTEAAAREAWRQTRRPGDFAATFQAGDTIRCPGSVQQETGRSVCGLKIGVAKPGSKVILRVREARNPAIRCAGLNLLPCPNCHTLCEQFVTWDTPLKATGS